MSIEENRNCSCNDNTEDNMMNNFNMTSNMNMMSKMSMLIFQRLFRKFYQMTIKQVQ